MLFSICCTSMFAVATFIDKSVNLSLKVGESKTYYPSTAAGVDSYNPSSVSAIVETSSGLTNPSVTDKIVKVTTGKEIGGSFRSSVIIQAIGVGECRVVCSCTYSVPLSTTMGIANIIYHVKVTEKEVLVSEISLNQTSVVTPVGKSFILLADILPFNASNQALSWSSSNSNVASVNSNGVVSANQVGSTIIEAKSTDGSNKSAVCNVKVIIPVSQIILSQNNLELWVNQSVTLSTVILPNNATNKKIIWISSNPEIVTIDENGKLKAQSSGNCVIVATSCDGSDVSATCAVTVTKPIPVSGIILSETEISLKEGKSVTLTASVTPSDASDKSVVWSSSDETIASVSQDGVVTAVSKGSAYITATSADGSGLSASCTVNVVKPVSGIVLSETEISLKKGESVILTASVTPSDATNTDLIWYSEDENVASVDNGLVTAIGEGRTYIIVESLDGANIVEKCKVIVDKSTWIESNVYDTIRVFVENGELYIANVPNYKTAYLYSLNGPLINSKLSKGNLIKFKLPMNGIYIVVVGTYRYKVIIQ